MLLLHHDTRLNLGAFFAIGRPSPLSGAHSHGHAPPPHFPDGGAAEMASAALSAPSHPAPATPAPDSSTNCTPQPAPCCVAEPQQPAHNICGHGGERIRAARQHITAARPPPPQSMHAPRARLPHSPPARPPLLHGAPCGAHILQRHEPPRASLLHAAAHARACSRTRPRWRGGVLACKLVACSFCCAALCGADP